METRRKQATPKLHFLEFKEWDIEQGGEEWRIERMVGGGGSEQAEDIGTCEQTEFVQS
jgi:hypothetical protein